MFGLLGIFSVFQLGPVMVLSYDRMSVHPSSLG